MKIVEHKINAQIEEFSLSTAAPQRISAIIPTFSRTEKSRFGTHCYYFYNFEKLKGICIRIRHKDIISPGLKNLSEANYRQYKLFPRLRMYLQKYHYGFNFFEQIMLMTVPHTVTSIGHGCFIVSLWSYYGYLLIDCKDKSITYKMMDENHENHLFGSRQLYDIDTESLYYMTFLLKAH